MGSLMLQKNSTLLFSSIVHNIYQRNFWQEVRKESADGGKFMIDLSIKYNPNRFIARNGEWSLPWKQKVPEKYILPKYDENFKLSYTEVTDLRAKQIKELINTNNQKFAVMYSGGIDSTLVMSALIKNLTDKELENIAVCANRQSIVENPNFWKNFIWGKFNVIESLYIKYDDLIEKGFRPITADEGDCIFGTTFGLEFFQHYDYYVSLLGSKSKTKFAKLKKQVFETHYSEYEELIIKHLSIPQYKKASFDTNFNPEVDPNFAKLWYAKLVKNIETSTVPVYTIFDFFWWMIFNLKYVNCAMRCSIYLNDRVSVKETVNDWVINWFNSKQYQLWSMVNNNNGEKIQSFGSSTYKMASRKYIHDLDKNDFYFYFKLKLASLGSSVMLFQETSSLLDSEKPNARFGVDKEYNVLSIDKPDVRNFILDNMSNYKIDWV